MHVATNVCHKQIDKRALMRWAGAVLLSTLILHPAGTAWAQAAPRPPAIRPNVPPAQLAPRVDPPPPPAEPAVESATLPPAASDETNGITDPTQPLPGDSGVVAPTKLPRTEGRPITGDIDPTEPLIFDFENVTLGEVIKALGPYTGKNFDIDQQISQLQVTLITHSPIPAKYAYEILQAILTSRGFHMVETVDGNLVKIRPVTDGAENAPMQIGHGEPEGFESFETFIVPLKNADATEIQPILVNLGSNKGIIDAFGPANTLIIYDTSTAIRRIMRFIEVIDVEGLSEEIDIFLLDWASAETLAQQITDVLTGGESGAAGEGVPQQIPGRARPPIPPRTPLRPNVPGQRSENIIASMAETLRIVPDERMNALIVVATPGMMDQVRDLVDLLDTDASPEWGNELHYHELLNADAETVESALNALTGTTPREATEGQAGAPAARTGEVQPFQKQVLVTRYDQTNSLLIVASPQDYKRIREIISQLDAPRRQVHVEAIIMEVIANNRFELSVELLGIDGEDAFGLNNVISLANILSSGSPLSVAGQSDSSILTAGIIDGTTEVAISDGAGGFTLQEIPNVPLLLQALESLTNLNVLSQPSLTTVDNELSSVVIGQEVPVITGSSSSLNQAAVGRNIFNSIQREDVGIKMEVTPQISEGDNVYLEIMVEVSQPIQSDVGGDPNIVGPTFQKTESETKVVVRDGSTGIIAGLLSETLDKSRRQTPILGDVPLLGWLFRRKSDRSAKRNLVILVTPHILKESLDTDRITDYRLEEFSNNNIDTLFEKGFIKKLERRHYERNERRPTKEKVDALEQREQFRRGESIH
ncbi:MAG: type II secretion system secretin GspD [Candidatus Hydrogenedentes bacterium]|nr:type II secretion system secretin GspD [Candidatus Hydrogenedentota bacterium]